MDGEFSLGSCDDSTPKKVVVTIKRPWWAFWRKDREVVIENPTISFNELDLSNDLLSVEISIKGEK